MLWRLYMTNDFKYYTPIEVRYGDLDPQWHVNNSRFLTFIEQARFGYLMHLGLWDGVNYLELGLIVADTHVSYLAPLALGQSVRVGARVARIGAKSILFEYQIEDSKTGQVVSTAETVMVAYDYHRRASKPVPEDWRNKISAFEGREF